jgi:hypothetical protein
MWSVIPVTPLAATEIAGSPRFVRLTLDDGRVVTLQSPTIETDSIYGRILERQAKGDRVAFSLSHVRQFDKLHMSAGRTALLLAGIGAAALVASFPLWVVPWRN